MSAPPADDRPARVQALLVERFAPAHLEVHDDSWQHRGHAGARGGGSHLRVVIAAAAFEGKTLVEQHRLVQDALKDLVRSGEVHALQLRTLPPSRLGPGPA